MLLAYKSKLLNNIIYQYYNIDIVDIGYTVKMKMQAKKRGAVTPSIPQRNANLPSG
jgi:hypothetical protein